MTEPLDRTPEPEECRTAFYDSVFTYCTRCQNPIDDGADEIALRIIELRHPDGDIAISVPIPRSPLATDARPVSNPQKDRRSLLPSRAD